MLQRSIIETIVLGAIQGVSEWLPVSSSGVLVLVQTQFWPQTSLSRMIEFALFLHAGTLLAAIVYFWGDIKAILFQKKQVLKSLIVSTLISSGLGFLLLQMLKQVEQQITVTGKVVTGLVGLLLIVTGVVQLKNGNNGKRNLNQTTIKDAVLLGLVQALTVLPGFSRSGLTVGLLLNLGFEKVDALKLSFLAGLPVILLSNIWLNLKQLPAFNFNWGLVVSFVIGLVSINLLFELAKKINFGYFVTFFGIITFIFSLI
jgi:undecaprenyl-diphosphatase